MGAIAAVSSSQQQLAAVSSSQQQFAAVSSSLQQLAAVSLHLAPPVVMGGDSESAFKNTSVRIGLNCQGAFLKNSEGRL